MTEARPCEVEAVKAAQAAMEFLTDRWDVAAIGVAAAYPIIFEAGRREGRREEAREVAAALRETVAKLGDIARQMP